MAKVSRETMTIGILAIFLGLVAAYGVRSLLMKPPEVPVTAAPAQPQTTALVASSDLPAGRIIAVGDIAGIRMTQKQFYERFKGRDFTQIMMDSKDIIGRRLREPLKQGGPFLTTALYLQGTGPSITAKLQAGFRAITLQVTETHGGNVDPGTYVDVVFRAQPRAAKAGEPAIPEMTVTLLRHIEVLEVSRIGTAQAAAEAKSLVTLAVPAEKAGVLSTVEGRGELWLVATSPQESKPAGIAGIAGIAGSKLTLEDVLGIQRPAPPKPAPSPFQTAIFRRGHMQVNTFVEGRLVSQSGHLPPAAPSSSTDSDCPTCGKKGAAAPLTPIPDSSAPAGSGVPTRATDPTEPPGSGWLLPAPLPPGKNT